MAYSTISKPSLHFNTKLSTGTGNSQAITGLGFKPDLIWGKRRDNSGHHSWFDVVRGITKGIESSSSSAEFTSTDYYSSFDSDGFTIAAGSGGAGNGSGQTAVQWCWKAGGSQGSSNTDGSINTTYTSVNTTAGFSIVKWTGTGSAGTLGHGLTTTPKMIIVKNLSDSVNWMVYHHSVITAGASNKSFMTLNTTDVLGTNGSATTFTSVSDTTFGVGTDNIVNGSSDNMIAYCFAEKKGFSKFGSYTGNGNNDGTFVYTGFKPKFLMIKNYTTGAYSWTINDDVRTPHNVMDKWLYPNSNTGEATSSSYNMDLLSNGFKSRNTGSNTNDNNNGYIYMAFAESPFVSSTGTPTTAR